jgi:hypothetical protein
MFPWLGKTRIEANSITGGKRGRWAGLFFAVLMSGCVQQMEDQPRVDTLEASPLHENESSYRPPLPGTIARGELPETTALATGTSDSKPVTDFPLELDRPLLERGQERYTIFCSHCHGPVGLGNGMVVQRGFPVPPSYHIDRLREMPVGTVFGVITNGHGRMPAFGKRIPPRDRWAIVAYVRALQLSQNLPATELSDSDRKQLPSREGQSP